MAKSSKPTSKTPTKSGSSAKDDASAPSATSQTAAASSDAAPAEAATGKDTAARKIEDVTNTLKARGAAHAAADGAKSTAEAKAATADKTPSADAPKAGAEGAVAAKDTAKETAKETERRAADTPAAGAKGDAKTGDETDSKTSGEAPKKSEAADSAAKAGAAKEGAKTSDSAATDADAATAAADKTAAEPVKTDKAEASAAAKPASTPTATSPLAGAAAAQGHDASSSSGGFFPALLGGVIAAGLGFGAAYVWLGDNTVAPAAVEALRKDVEALKSAPAPSVDTAPIERAAAEARSAAEDAGAQIAALSDRTLALEARLTALEASGVSSSLSPDAVKAYEAELMGLQKSMAEQRAALEAAATAAANAEASAEESAKTTLARAALARVQAALDSGSGYADALADLAEAGVAVPAALAATAQKGAPTLALLRDTYPDAARAALAQARKDAGPEAGKGIADFLKAQLGARSLAPREGNDPDAILSRVEAALGAGRLNDVMAEVSALPEAARARMGDWLAEAQKRLDAVAATQTLAQDLNQN